MSGSAAVQLDSQQVDGLLTALETKSVHIKGCMSRMRLNAVCSVTIARRAAAPSNKIQAAITTSIMLPQADIK